MGTGTTDDKAIAHPSLYAQSGKTYPPLVVRVWLFKNVQIKQTWTEKDKMTLLRSLENFSSKHVDKLCRLS